jgi:Glycine-zipper domain
MNSSSKMLALAGVLLLGGCASVPTGPSVMALPGTGKDFTEFRIDDAECRQFAQYQVGGTTADREAADAGVRSAIVGTVIGAAAGAALGGQHGAGVGAGAGLLVGSMAGTGASQRSAYGTQRQYDNAYIQCMYSKGQRVPVAGELSRGRTTATVRPAPATAGVYMPPPPPDYAPPPPPGSPPPPPLR